MLGRCQILVLRLYLDLRLRQLAATDAASADQLLTGTTRIAEYLLLDELEAALEHADKIWEAVSHSHVVKEIPVIRQAVALYKTFNDARSALLVSKLQKFVTDPSLQTPEARARMREQSESPDGKKIGEVLLMVLDRLTDMLKPTWLARCYAGFLAGEFGSSDLRRLASAIDMAFGDDLVALLAAPEPIQSNEYAPWKRYLTASGLTEMGAQGPIGGKTVFHVTELGTLFRSTVRRHSP
jgi:hypothetical protein